MHAVPTDGRVVGGCVVGGLRDWVGEQVRMLALLTVRLIG